MAAFNDMLVAEVSDRRCICIYDWGCMCVIDDEIDSGYLNVDEKQEDEAFRQFLSFLLEDVVFPSSSLPGDAIEPFRLTDEDQDSLTLTFANAKGRKNPIENDVVYLEPTESAEDRRKKCPWHAGWRLARACLSRVSNSSSSGGRPTRSTRGRSFLRSRVRCRTRNAHYACTASYTGFLQEVDVIGQALAMPADIDAESKDLYLMTYEYLEVEARQKVMQERFDIIKASLSLFKALRESSESTRKERIIIWLLVVCVVIAALELLVKVLSLRRTYSK